jgi:protein associated with RNAse G/E
MMGESVTVRVLKYDGTEYRRWRAQLREVRDQLLIFDAEFEDEVTHDSLGTIPRGTRTIEYYWLDRWYNIFQFLKDAGDTRLFYCNINTPPSWEGDGLSYVDLDIDILVEPDLSFQVLDSEEFAANAELYAYPEDVKERAETAVKELKQMIEHRQFPFGNDLK